MIAFLDGIIHEKKPNKVVLDVSGVGYEVGISTQTYASLPATGQKCRLHTYHHMTESEQRLFGFLDHTEMSLFELLITVKGVGPRLALTILSGLPANDISACIAREDAIMLARTPGIGKKTAERIVLELRDKISAAAAFTGNSPGDIPPPGAGSEAVSALEALGFKRVDAEKAVLACVKELPEATSTGELVRASLQRLYR
jgi:Holliday junction DNA helicase RuvA